MPSVPEPPNTRERFQQLAKQPDAARWLNPGPAARPRPRAASLLRLTLFAFLALLATVFILMISVSGIALFGPLSIVPFILLLLAAIALLAATWKRHVAESKPIERYAALVVELATRMVAGSGSTLEAGQYATLEFSDGARRDYRVSESVTAALTPNGMGIALLQNGTLVEFRSIPA